MQSVSSIDSAQKNCNQPLVRCAVASHRNSCV